MVLVVSDGESFEDRENVRVLELSVGCEAVEGLRSCLCEGFHVKRRVETLGHGRSCWRHWRVTRGREDE